MMQFRFRLFTKKKTNKQNCDTRKVLLLIINILISFVIFLLKLRLIFIQKKKGI